MTIDEGTIFAPLLVAVLTLVLGYVVFRWWRSRPKLSAKDLKMLAVKKTINAFVPTLSAKIPEIHEPKRPASQAVRWLFTMFRESVKIHPARFYEDGNFPRLLDAVERAMIYLSEEDGHYAGWIAQAMLLIYVGVGETRAKFKLGIEGDVEWLQWMAQHPIKAVKIEETN